MKLASYRDGSRDGQLIVVSRDLSLAHYASGIAGRLQQALDDWNFLSPQLEELSQTLNHGKARHAFAFDPAACLAPLPRAFQHAVARGDDAPSLLQLPGDALHGPQDAIAAPADGQPINSGAGLAVITGDLAAGSTPEAALESIRLLMLTSEAGGEIAFGPVAVTPDELGTAWHGGHMHLGIDIACDGRRSALASASDAGRAHFGALIASLCRTRAVRAGSIVGWCAIGGTFRERLRVEVKGSDGASIFGGVDRRVAAPEVAALSALSASAPAAAAAPADIA